MQDNQAMLTALPEEHYPTLSRMMDRYGAEHGAPWPTVELPMMGALYLALLKPGELEELRAHCVDYTIRACIDVLEAQR